MQHLRSNQTTRFKAYFFVLLSSLIYGGNVIAGRLIAGLVPPFTLSAIRVVLGLIILLPLAWPQMKKAPKPNKMEWFQLVIISILGIVVPYVALLLGLQQTTGTNASVVFATLPAVTNTLIFLLYKLKPSKFQTLGMITSFMGLMIVFTQGSLLHLLTFKLGVGELYLFINVLSIGLFNLLGQNIMHKFSSLVTSIYALIFAAIMLIPMGAWQLKSSGWNVSMSEWLIILYMGFLAAGVAFFLNLYGINKIGSGKASIFSNMQHVFSITLSVIILKESLAAYHWIGFILVISGVLLSLSKSSQKVTSN
ncbi:DMT family transporter [Desulfosporosinus metallidurans]|uniref:Permease of the drug/metabolite transporter (DMT) superfamily n=1 Tax=Desulfosporosinus metallidurans TaxID=1888891 RepID=A0A1Q8QIH6_9FIRM|nr:DMT family transporter [Desulfosporosinus metallidurans]OLN27125.1 Permease of the drug/metabolite transporter (DMT) superfamily [Desulfosporosinus metallidurans]